MKKPSFMINSDCKWKRRSLTKLRSEAAEDGVHVMMLKCIRLCSESQISTLLNVQQKQRLQNFKYFSFLYRARLLFTFQHKTPCMAKEIMNGNVSRNVFHLFCVKCMNSYSSRNFFFHFVRCCIKLLFAVCSFSIYLGLSKPLAHRFPNELKS